MCNKKKLDKIKAMIIVANAQKKHRRIFIGERLGFIFVQSVMLIIQQVRNNYAYLLLANRFNVC